MNERIQQLAEQAGVGFMFDPDAVVLTFKMEKFAELIVQECIEQASIGNGHGNNQWDRALTFAVKNIKEHFGVDE